MSYLIAPSFILSHRAVSPCRPSHSPQPTHVVLFFRVVISSRLFFLFFNRRLISLYILFLLFRPYRLRPHHAALFSYHFAFTLFVIVSPISSLSRRSFISLSRACSSIMFVSIVLTTTTATIHHITTPFVPFRIHSYSSHSSNKQQLTRQIQTNKSKQQHTNK